MAKFNLRQIVLYVPQYDTTALITVDEDHQSGTPHLWFSYDKVPPHGDHEYAAAIPEDWTDQDLAELIFFACSRGRIETGPIGKFQLGITDPPHCFVSGRARSQRTDAESDAGPKPRALFTFSKLPSSAN